MTGGGQVHFSVPSDPSAIGAIDSHSRERRRSVAADMLRKVRESDDIIGKQGMSEGGKWASLQGRHEMMRCDHHPIIPTFETLLPFKQINTEQRKRGPSILITCVDERATPPKCNARNLKVLLLEEV